MSMKRRDLEKELKALGFILQTGSKRGGKHDKWVLGSSTQMVPRHTEINKNTARKILEQAKKAAGKED